MVIILPMVICIVSIIMVPTFVEFLNNWNEFELRVWQVFGKISNSPLQTMKQKSLFLAALIPSIAAFLCAIYYIQNDKNSNFSAAYIAGCVGGLLFSFILLFMNFFRDIAVLFFMLSVQHGFRQVTDVRFFN